MEDEFNNFNKNVKYNKQPSDKPKQPPVTKQFVLCDAL